MRPVRVFCRWTGIPGRYAACTDDRTTGHVRTAELTTHIGVSDRELAQCLSMYNSDRCAGLLRSRAFSIAVEDPQSQPLSYGFFRAVPLHSFLTHPCSTVRE